MLITPRLRIGDDEIELTAIRAQGAGGQNVNKLSTAIHLRFDIQASSLPARVKARLLKMPDRRVNKDGILIIKAQRHRSQDKNRADALDRLRALIAAAAAPRKPRRATKPSARARQRRLDAKHRRGKTKQLRGRVVD